MAEEATKTDATYQVLARKWRPRRFAEIVGQDAVARTLQNSIEVGRTAHAYLFAGPRGVGKTSLARIFAKALNCEKGPAREPCLECTSCREIAAGISPDVIEIDGASNRGIDDVREIRERVKYAPAHSRLKIYIIDEVHMLTEPAFNALLKTLEEPPAHVKFFFATTAPHKVIATILSRCQQFHLKRIPTARIAQRLREIAESENLRVEGESLHLIARSAEGSMRDAQSMFDQIISFCGPMVTVKDVASVLGTVAEEVFDRVDEAAASGHVKEALDIAAHVVDEGKDIPRFLDDLISHFRDLLVAKSTQHPERVLDLPAEAAKKVATAATRFSQEQLLHILEVLTEAQDRLRGTTSPRIAIEMALIRLVRSSDRIALDELVERLERLEGRPAIGSGSGGAPVVRETALQDLFAPAAGAKKKAIAPAPDPPAALEPLDAGEISEFNAVWSRLVEGIAGVKPRLGTDLSFGRILDYKDGVVTIVFDPAHAFQKESASKRENWELVEKFLSEHIGQTVRVKFADKEGGTTARPVPQEQARPQVPPAAQDAARIFGGQITEPQ